MKIFMFGPDILKMCYVRFMDANDESRALRNAMYKEYESRLQQTREGINVKDDMMDPFALADAIKDYAMRPEAPNEHEDSDDDYGEQQRVDRSGGVHAAKDVRSFVRPPGKGTAPQSKRSRQKEHMDEYQEAIRSDDDELNGAKKNQSSSSSAAPQSSAAKGDSRPSNRRPGTAAKSKPTSSTSTRGTEDQQAAAASSAR